MSAYDEETEVKAMDGGASLTSFSPSMLIQSHKLEQKASGMTQVNTLPYSHVPHMIKIQNLSCNCLSGDEYWE